MSPYSDVAALNPWLPFSDLILSTTTDASSPALSTICLMGASIAFKAIEIPMFWSSLSPLRPSDDCNALIKATPPPGTTPSSTAALVECKASSTLAFFSFISISEPAPTLITATPPANLATLSWSFSLS